MTVSLRVLLLLVLFEWLEDDNKKQLLHASNVCLGQRNMDPFHLHAVVVSIYKTGDASKLPTIDQYHC